MQGIEPAPNFNSKLNVWRFGILGKLGYLMQCAETVRLTVYYNGLKLPNLPKEPKVMIPREIAENSLRLY